MQVLSMCISASMLKKITNFEEKSLNSINYSTPTNMTPLVGSSGSRGEQCSHLKMLDIRNDHTKYGPWYLVTCIYQKLQAMLHLQLNTNRKDRHITIYPVSCDHSMQGCKTINNGVKQYYF